jgi:endonuclease/exonuclease/phosphatase (EEP) superfamily protein YafD
MTIEHPRAGTSSAWGRADRARSAWLWTVRSIQAASVSVALVHPIASLLSRTSWIADLISHFQEPALASSLFASLLVIRRYPRFGIALLLLATWQVVPLVRYSGSNPVPADPTSASKLKILMANVLWDNPRSEDLLRLIRSEQPDVVGLIEFTTSWRDALAEIREQYPYRMEAPAGPSGLALWFRERPLRLDPAARLTEGGWPVLHATFAFAGRERELWLVHPSAPVIATRKRAGFPELAAIAERVRNLGGSTIVIGDLNSTDGSAHFRDFLHVSGLRDSRLGFGRQGSWPSNRLYGLAIDHAFVSDDLAVVDRRLGPNIGSDHLPLVVELAPAVSRKPATQLSQP